MKRGRRKKRRKRRENEKGEEEKKEKRKKKEKGEEKKGEKRKQEKRKKKKEKRENREKRREKKKQRKNRKKKQTKKERKKEKRKRKRKREGKEGNRARKRSRETRTTNKNSLFNSKVSGESLVSGKSFNFKEEINNSVLGWSLITENTDSLIELIEIAEKVIRQRSYDVLEMNMSNITLSTDYNNLIDGDRGEKFLADKVSNNTIIALKGNNSSIHQLTENNNKDIVSGKRYSTLECKSNTDNIGITVKKKENSESKARGVDEESSVESIKEESSTYRRITSKEEDKKSETDNVARDSEVEDILWAGSQDWSLNLREKRETDEIEVEYTDSISSMEDEIRWLFEKKQEYNHKRTKLDNSYDGSYKSSLEGDRKSSLVEDNSWEPVEHKNISNSNEVLDVARKKIKSSSRRRRFWLKWKNKIRNRDRNKSRKADKSLYKEGIQQKSIEAVFDNCSKGLEKAEIELLSKGSTFCIANNKIEEDRFKVDIYAYSRRLRLHEEFRDQGGDTNYSQLFSQIIRDQRDSYTNREFTQKVGGEVKKVRKLPSTYDPDSQNRNLARYCNCIQEESILAIKTKVEFKDNISREHRRALDTLKKKIEDKDIVITLADKGSGIVVVDYSKYIDKGTYYIEEEAKAYSVTQKTQKQIVTDIVKERNRIVKKLREHKVIEVETATYCMKQLEEKVTGMKFYYKVHKDTNIDTMPLRPLQSCIGAPTQHLSQVLTDILQSFLTQDYIPTFIQDSNQLLYRLNKIGKLDISSTLISSDVAALYPSIPHKEGLWAVKTFLLEFLNYNSTQINFIMQALELVITQNFVMWNGKIYTQDSGVAMGTPVAVAYANIFMDWIDKQLGQRATYIIEHIRYIDDNLFILPEEKIEELMVVTNTLLVPHIRFTYEKLDKNADNGLPFLDTQLFISSELMIESRLYTKKTDKHTYLLPTPFHPSHITKNIPIAVFNRIRRICSSYEWFQADAMKAIQWLEDRGYRYVNIKRAVESSGKKDRWEMINKIEEKRINKLDNIDKDKTVYEVPVIITYSHNTSLLREVLNKRQPLLDASFSQTKVRPRVSFRRQRNINDLLIQRSLRKPIIGNEAEERILVLCGGKPKYRIPCPCKSAHDQQICRCCAYMKVKLDNIKVRLHKKVNCESKNLIYIIGCGSCKKLYIGETQQQLKERFLHHLNNIYKLSQPLYTHFSKVHKAENMYVSVLETVKSNDHSFRKIREAWWINKLQTLEPRGFNIKLECSQIYQAMDTTMNIERRRRSIWA